MEKETPYRRDELLKWSVQEFKNNIIYLARWNHARKIKDDLMRKKK